MSEKIVVWDLPTRICHWSLVVSIGYSWYCVEIAQDMEQHFWSGYTILTLILFRFIWGFVGSRYARFRSFLFPLKEIASYAKSVKSRNTNKHYLGHNPIGSLSALAMMLAILLQASTGLFNSDDYYFGPLSGLIDKNLAAFLSSIHQLNFDLLKLLIATHVIAILYYKFYKKENLSKAMITGKKTVLATDKQNYPAAIRGSNLVLALLVLALCAAIVYGLANAFTDTLAGSEYDLIY
jgi:cytochrome b